MARAKTWAEFKDKPDSEKRVIVLLQARERAVPANVVDFVFSNIEREEPIGFTGIIHKGVSSVPALRYNTNEIGGNPPAPSWSDIILTREDGYDISPDGSGIYFDDLGKDYILENQPAFVWFGGDDVPWLEYRKTFSGTMGSPAKDDMTLTVPCFGNENRAYRDTIAKTTITAAAFPFAPTGNLGKTIPFCIGFISHMEPICVDSRAVAPNNMRFAFHDNTVPYSILQVKDAGVTLTGAQYTNNGDGTFTLALGYIPNGAITCVVLGAWGFSPWATDITNLITTFSAGAIDAAAVAAANIALPWEVNYLVQSEMSVMDVIRQLSVGVPAYYSFQRDGVFRMEEITDPALKTPDHIINSEMSNISPVAILDNSLSIKPTGQVIDTASISYYENFAVLSRQDLSASLSETQKSILYTTWRQDTYTDPTVSVLYDNPAKKSTLVRVTSIVDSQDAAVRWVNLLKISRSITTIKIKCQDLIYNIGDIVSVTFKTELKDGTPWYRHGLNDTRMMIIGINENYDRFETVLTLWG